MHPDSILCITETNGKHIYILFGGNVLIISGFIFIVFAGFFSIFDKSHKIDSEKLACFHQQSYLLKTIDHVSINPEINLQNSLDSFNLEHLGGKKSEIYSNQQNESLDLEPVSKKALDSSFEGDLD